MADRDHKRHAEYVRLTTARLATAGTLIVCLAAAIAWLAVAHAETTSRATPAHRLRPSSARDPRLARAAGPSLPRLVASLSLAQLAGQRVVYAYSGYQPPASLLSLIRSGEAGGVILFGPNIAGQGQIRRVIGELQQAALASPLHRRLLILTDQEGGEVRRLPGAPVLSEKQIGASPNALALAAAAGRGAGHNLSAAGIDVNLAPVLDVFRSAGNFIDQYQRSYSSDPTTVASLGAAFIRAQQPLGVAATAKHFPGLGAAEQSENTDAAPVTLDISAARLRAVDEAPYRAAIAAGVKLVMVSWAIYPALDPVRPAGLSPAIVTGELRGRLGFDGVTVTDGIDAGAVTPFGSLARRSVLAAAAGDDLILAVTPNPGENTPRLGIGVLHALTAAMATDRLSLASARVSAARILALRARP